MNTDFCQGDTTASSDACHPAISTPALCEWGLRGGMLTRDRKRDRGRESSGEGIVSSDGLHGFLSTAASAGRWLIGVPCLPPWSRGRGLVLYDGCGHSPEHPTAASQLHSFIGAPTLRRRPGRQLADALCATSSRAWRGGGAFTDASSGKSASGRKAG